MHTIDTNYFLDVDDRICFDSNMQQNCLNNTKTCYLYVEKSKNETEETKKGFEWTTPKIASGIGALLFTVSIYIGALYFVYMQKSENETQNVQKNTEQCSEKYKVSITT